MKQNPCIYSCAANSYVPAEMESIIKTRPALPVMTRVGVGILRETRCQGRDGIPKREKTPSPQSRPLMRPKYILRKQTRAREQVLWVNQNWLFKITNLDVQAMEALSARFVHTFAKERSYWHPVIRSEPDLPPPQCIAFHKPGIHNTATVISERKTLHSFSPELKRNEVLPTIARGIQHCATRLGRLSVYFRLISSVQSTYGYC